MATVFDLGLLNQFSDIFAWILIFVVVYGILQVSDIFKSRGINALIAISATILLGITSNTTAAVVGLLPWFVIVGFFLVFLLLLGNFIGISTADILGRFGDQGAIWWIFVPLIIGLVVALIAGGQLSRSDVDPETGEIAPGKTLINVFLEPKVLAMVIILSISAITVAIMTAYQDRSES